MGKIILYPNNQYFILNYGNKCQPERRKLKHIGNLQTQASKS